MSDTGRRRRRNPLRPATIAGIPGTGAADAGRGPEETVPPPIAEQEPFGWFRDEPPTDEAATATVAELPAEPIVAVDEGAAAGRPEEVAAPAAGEAEGTTATLVGETAGETAPVEAVAAPELLPAGTEPGVEPVEPVEAAAVTPAPVAAPRRRGSAAARLRTLVFSVLAIGVTAVLGFAAGTVLPTLVPGPGIVAVATASPTAEASPTALQTAAPTATAEPTVEPTPTPAPTAEPTPTPTPKPIVHVVKPGEYLTMIAAKYGVTVKAIQELNGIKDPNKISVGQKLIIPPKP